jgi:predicted ATP-grasp superfamily ATP-dependent carboligase
VHEQRGLRTVTVFDADLPPGIAFIRSLGRAGVPVVACSKWPTAAGRFSRYTSRRRSCPSVHQSDRFISWLVDELGNGSIDLIAPTSDFVSFCVAEALELLESDSARAGHPQADAIRTCLFKGRFADAMEKVDFPTPPTRIPGSLAEAHEAADTIGYPLTLKPRSHVGVGTHRGIVVRTPAELTRVYAPYEIGDAHAAALRHVPDLRLPMIQRYHELGTVDVISVSGCLDLDGTVLALGHSRKVGQAPRRFGVGTMFEPGGAQPFTDAAVDAVREILGSGLFELEVLVDKATSEYWAIDLNPRGFGQMSLDIALGNDLPRIWYESVSGTSLPVTPARRPPPELWHEAVSTYVGFAVRFARGPRRMQILHHALERIGRPSVGATHDWRDPAPGLIFGLSHFRHPRALIRPFVADTELATYDGYTPRAKRSDHVAPT